MVFNRNNVKATVDHVTPIGQAISSLKESRKILKSLSDDSELYLDEILISISGAIDFLSEITNPGTKSLALVDNVNSAMNHLRGVLSNLQSLSTKASGLDDIIRTIAKILALLFPLSRLDNSKTPKHPITSCDPVPPHIMERRKAERAAVEAEVGFQSDTNFFIGFSEDISTGGLFVATYEKQPLGSVINLNFTLPGGHLISVDGVVRWVREYNDVAPDTSPGMGIQFENLRFDDKEAIEKFINERPAMFYDDE